MEEVGRLKSEHHDLRSSLGELEAMLDAQGGATGSLAQRLDDFLDELREHFAFEENGTLFADIAAKRASFDREVKRLIRQHAEILASFTSARGVAGEGTSVDDVAPSLRKAMKLLLGHERAEMDLLQEAALTDLGGGD